MKIVRKEYNIRQERARETSRNFGSSGSKFGTRRFSRLIHAKIHVSPSLKVKAVRNVRDKAWVDLWELSSISLGKRVESSTSVRNNSTKDDDTSETAVVSFDRWNCRSCIASNVSSLPISLKKEASMTKVIVVMHFFEWF